MSHLGERISQLRRNKGLTQEQLGSLLSVSAQAVAADVLASKNKHLFRLSKMR